MVHESVPAELKELLWQETLLSCTCEDEDEDEDPAAGDNWIPKVALLPMALLDCAVMYTVSEDVTEAKLTLKVADDASALT